MKKSVVVFLAIVAAACQKGQSDPVVQIEGMWAEYNGTELTKSFYEFKDGKYDYFTSEQDYLLRYSDLWGADRTDFTRYDFGNYSIQNGKLFLNERSAGEISRDSVILSIGPKRYLKINGLKKGVEGASKIILDTNSMTMNAFGGQEMIGYRVINLLPGQDAPVAEYRDSVDWTLYPFVTSRGIIVGAQTNYSGKTRVAHLVVSYPWAEDETINFTQLAE